MSSARTGAGAGRAPGVLVLDGASGPALATVRSLGAAGWRVLTERGTRSAGSRHVARALPIPEAHEGSGPFLAAVADCLRAEPVDVVVPCTDASMTLLAARPELLGAARVMGAPLPLAVRLTDKAEILDAAERAGFPVPPWAAPRDADEALAAARELGYPCVLKPRRSYRPENGRLRHVRHDFARSPAELEANLRARGGADLPLLQRFVPGRALSVGVVLHEGAVLARVARETFSWHPIQGGTSVWKATVPPDAPGVEAAVRMLREIGYEGLGEVEYQLDAEGVPRLMEVGVRAFGWMHLARAAGSDLALVAARALLGAPARAPEGYRVGLHMRWPAGELARLRDACRRSPVLPPGVTRRQVAALAWPPWRPGMRYDGLERGDWGPWLPGPARDRLARSTAPATRSAA